MNANVISKEAAAYNAKMSAGASAHAHFEKMLLPYMGKKVTTAKNWFIAKLDTEIRVLETENFRIRLHASLAYGEVIWLKLLGTYYFDYGGERFSRPLEFHFGVTREGILTEIIPFGNWPELKAEEVQKAVSEIEELTEKLYQLKNSIPFDFREKCGLK